MNEDAPLGCTMLNYDVGSTRDRAVACARLHQLNVGLESLIV
jgi:hypothetical protein